jgi:HipA-like C-terminal domain
MNDTATEIKERLLIFLSTGIRTSEEIQHRFSCSQPTVSRLLSCHHDRIFVIGKARARKYTRLRDVRGLGGEFPVYTIDSVGDARIVGTLYAVAHDEYFWRPLVGGEELFRSLPWFIADLRPEGFVGRAFVRQLHHDLGLPPRSIDWREDHVLTALARRGENCMGNLVIGQESLERYFRSAREVMPPIHQEELSVAYPRMALDAMDGQPAGSSAGGEQPKFTTLVERDGEPRNVLVKFSPPVATEEGRRWADLLICEHHALQIIQGMGISAAQSCLVEAGGRVFLEVVRFDRTGLLGRKPIISLRAIDNEFYGFQDNWINAANRIEADGRLSSSDASSLRWLSVFGTLIANNDQHFGNVSLVMVDGRRRFELAPAYDVLPMYYRPMDGAAPSCALTPPAIVPGAHREWDTALHWAGVFWENTSQDNRISEEFRQICAKNIDAVLGLKNGPRMVVPNQKRESCGAVHP